MEEWQKTLISTGIGFAAGVCSEPIKAALARSRQRKILRNAIDQAMADVCNLLAYVAEDENEKLFQPHLPFDQFQHYFEKEKSLFYDSVVAWHACWFFEKAKPILLEPTVENRAVAAAELLNAMFSWEAQDREFWSHRFLGKYTQRLLKHLREKRLDSPSQAKGQSPSA